VLSTLLIRSKCSGLRICQTTGLTCMRLIPEDSSAMADTPRYDSPVQTHRRDAQVLAETGYPCEAGRMCQNLLFARPPRHCSGAHAEHGGKETNTVW